MNTSNFLGQTSLCKSSIAQSRMCCIALFSASGNPSVQKVPTPQASALRLKSILQKCAACIRRMQNARGLGTAQQAFWIWFLEIGFKNCKLVPACPACHNNASFLSAICNFQIGEKRHGKDEGWRKALNLDQILFNCRDYLRAARNSGSFFEKRDIPRSTAPKFSKRS